MNLDELMAQWNSANRKLDRLVALSEERIRISAMQESRSAARRQALPVVVELIFNVLSVALLGAFLAANAGAVRFVVPAIVLDVLAIFLVAFGAYQLVALKALDVSGSVLSVQEKLGALQAQRNRVTMWTLIAAPLVWTPLLIVALRGLFGIDAYAVLGAGFLIANAAFGVAFLAVALWASNRFAGRLPRFPALANLADDLSGRSLKKGAAFLSQLARFEQEDA